MVSRKEQRLYHKDGSKQIADNALVAMTLMIAENSVIPLADTTVEMRSWTSDDDNLLITDKDEQWPQWNQPK